MTDLTKFEKRAMQQAVAMPGASFTPTELGMAMGYAQTAASSRVAPALRTLLAAGALTKTQISTTRVRYAVNPASPLAKACLSASSPDA